MRITGTCQNEEISSIIPYIGSLLAEPVAIFRSIFNAFEAYINSAKSLNGKAIDIDGIPIDSTIEVIFLRIGYALMNFANYAAQIFEGFIANLRKLITLPNSTFTNLLNAVITAQYQVVTLMRDVSNLLIRTLRRSQTSSLQRAINLQLSTIKTFLDRLIDFISRTFRELGTRNSKLEADIATLTGQLATQTGDQAAATQKKIDDANDEISKNKQVIQVMRNLIELSRSISRDIAREI